MVARSVASLAPVSNTSTLVRTGHSLLSGTTGFLSVAVVLLAALAAAAGLLVPELYRDAPIWVAQARGQDLVTLVVAVPVLALGLVGARRGSMRAFLVWLGSVGYLAYTYATYAFAAHFNALFVVYVAAFGLAVFTLVFGLMGVDVARVARAFGARTPTRLVGTALIGMAAVTALLWLGQDVPAVLSGRVPSDVAEAGLLTNPIHVLDLGLVLPAAVLAGVLLLRRHAWGFVLGAYFLVKFATLGFAILSMTLFMVADGLPVDFTLSAIFAIWTLASVVLAWRFLADTR